jgi:hypothetical protein
MAVHQSRLTSVLAKVESPEGTDATPAAADGFYATASPPNVQLSYIRNENFTGKGSLLPGVVSARRFEGHLEQNLRGAGAAYSAGVKPKADSLLRMCGFLATGTYTGGSEKYDYTLKSSAFESFSVYQYIGEKLFKLLGCRGLPSMSFPLGGIASVAADLRAIYTAPTDVAITYPTGEASTSYPIMLGSAFQIGTQNFAAKHGSITINFNRSIVPREDGTSAAGFAGMEMLGERAPEITFECESTTEAGFPFFSNLLAGTQMDCSFGVGSTQYNRVKVNIPAMQFQRVEQTAKSGLIYYRATCLLVSPGGTDDEITLTFD